MFMELIHVYIILHVYIQGKKCTGGGGGGAVIQLEI